MLGAGDDGHRIENRPIRVLRRAKRLLHLLGARGGVGRVDEARVDLAPRDVVERLADVSANTSLACSRSQRPSARKLSPAYWPTGTVLGLPMTIFVTRGSRRSDGLVRSILESAGLTTVSTLRANTRRVAARTSPFFSSSSICRGAAEMKRSTGAPASI